MLGFLKRRGWLILGLLAAGALTFTYLERQREQIFEHTEWQALTRTLAAVDADTRPAQAGLFISTDMIERYLESYVGLRAELPERWPLLKGTQYATIEKIDARGGKGLMTARARMRFAELLFDVHLALLFDGIEPVTRIRNGGSEKLRRVSFRLRPVATLPHAGPWGILSWWDSGHNYQSAAAEAADAIFERTRGIQLDVPAEIALPIGQDRVEPLEFRQPAGDGRDVVTGAMKLRKSLPAVTVRRELFYAPPVFIDRGVVLLARTSKAPPAANVAPPAAVRPDLDTLRRQLTDLRWRFEAVARQMHVAGKDFELWLEKSLLTELLGEIAVLPESQRRLTLSSSEPSGSILERSDASVSAYTMRLRPGSLAGMVQLQDTEVAAPPGGEVRLTGRLAVEAQAITTAQWDSWLLAAPGSYEVAAAVTGSAALQGSLKVFTATRGKAQGAYWGLDLPCTPVVVEARSEQGRVASIGPFRHGGVRSRFALKLFEGKAKAAALIRSDVRRFALFPATVADAPGPDGVRLVPKAQGVDIAWLADDAGPRGEAYRISGRIWVQPAPSAQLSADERRVSEELSGIAAEADFPGEHACPPEIAAQTSIEGITADPPEAALSQLLKPARSDADKLRLLSALKRDPKVPKAALALVEHEIAAVTSRIETAVDLARRAKEEADLRLEEARRRATEAAERLDSLLRQLPEPDQRLPRLP